MDSTIPRKRLADILRAIAEMEQKYQPALLQRLPRRRRQPAPADPVRRQRPRPAAPLRGLRRRHPGDQRGDGRHGDRRARRGRREAQLDVRAVLAPRSVAMMIAVKTRLRPGRPAQPRQGHPDAAPLRRIRPDACAPRPAAVPRAAAFLMGAADCIPTSVAPCSPAARAACSTRARRPEARRWRSAATGSKAGLSGEPAGRRAEPARPDAACAASRAYEPSELVVTARAGTPIDELEAELARRRASTWPSSRRG